MLHYPRTSKYFQNKDKYYGPNLGFKTSEYLKSLMKHCDPETWGECIARLVHIVKHADNKQTLAACQVLITTVCKLMAQYPVLQLPEDEVQTGKRYSREFLTQIQEAHEKFIRSKIDMPSGDPTT